MIMKSANSISVLRIVFLAFIFLGTMSLGEAYGQGSPVYLGEHCWEGGGGFLRIGLTHQGDGHVIGGGLASDAGADWAVDGSLELVGDNLLLTHTESATLVGGTYVFSRVGNTVLDFETLNGTSHFMDMTWENNTCTLDHYSFDVTYVDCESGLPSEAADKREELKRLLRIYSTKPEENRD
jgi:hypothetical protein